MKAWKPAGYPSMSPYPICKDAERLIGFLQDPSGGVLLRKFDRPKPTNFITQYRSVSDARRHFLDQGSASPSPRIHDASAVRIIRARSELR
jgi:hypothetical protein